MNTRVRVGNHKVVSYLYDVLCSLVYSLRLNGAVKLSKTTIVQ